MSRPPHRPLSKAAPAGRPEQQVAEAEILQLSELPLDILRRGQLAIEGAYRRVRQLPREAPVAKAARLAGADVLELAALGTRHANAGELADALNVASGRWLAAAIRVERRERKRGADAAVPD